MTSQARGQTMSEFALPTGNSQLDNVVFSNQHPHSSDKRPEILSGLQQKKKSIDPKYFYDIRGSELFEQITQLPEYYPTRTERKILKRHAQDMAECCGQNCVLIEPGSGSSEKVRLLLDTMKPAAYVPMDISADFLQRSAIKLGEEYPWLKIHAVCTDFARQEKAPEGLPGGKRVVFYPGSTLGNMKPAAASDFLRHMGHWLNENGGVLIGIDMHKSTKILDAAYNDAQGITAAFNLNMLSNINILMNANFDIENFSHHAFYNEKEYRIEMHLVSKLDQIVRLGDTDIAFARGETIHTENSYKYTLESFQEIAQSAGFVIRSSWSDEQQLFSVHYLELARAGTSKHAVYQVERPGSV